MFPSVSDGAVVGLGSLEHDRKPSRANHRARHSFPTSQSGSEHTSTLEVNSFFVMGALRWCLGAGECAANDIGSWPRLRHASLFIL